MGKFDNSIASYLKQKTNAVEDLKGYESGVRQWTGPEGTIEITAELIENAKRRIDLLDRLVVAYQKHNG